MAFIRAKSKIEYDASHTADRTSFLTCHLPSGSGLWRLFFVYVLGLFHFQFLLFVFRFLFFYYFLFYLQALIVGTSTLCFASSSTLCTVYYFYFDDDDDLDAKGCWYFDKNYENFKHVMETVPKYHTSNNYGWKISNFVNHI